MTKLADFGRFEKMSQSNKGHFGQILSKMLLFLAKKSSCFLLRFPFLSLPKFKFWSNREQTIRRR